MTHYKGNAPPKKPDGLTGVDKQQGDLKDDRKGAYDPVTPGEESVPEGLRRPLKGPLSPTRGRKGE